MTSAKGGLELLMPEFDTQNSKEARPASMPKIAVYPSPVLVAGPFLMAVCLLVGGVAKGVLLPRHSTPALVLLVLSYLFSRWFRRSAVVFGEETVAMGADEMRYSDIGSIKIEKGDGWARRFPVLNLYDRNGVIRLALQLGAYGKGMRRICDELRRRCCVDIVDSDAAVKSTIIRLSLSWGAIGILCVLSLWEGISF